MSDPVAESGPSVHAGCVAGPDQGSAGCDGQAGSEGPAAAPLQAPGDGAGCAAQGPADASEAQATPPQTVREFERALRGLGFTRLQASSIARQGFSGATAQEAPPPEPPPDETHDLRAALDRLAQTLKDSP